MKLVLTVGKKSGGPTRWREDSPRI